MTAAICLLILARSGPPIVVVEQTAGPTSTRFVIRAGRSKAAFELPGIVRSTPYDENAHDIPTNKAHTVMAINTFAVDHNHVCLIQSTANGLHVTPDFDVRVTRLLCSKRAHGMFVGHLYPYHADDWREAVNRGIAPHLWVDGIGSTSYTGRVAKQDEIQMRAQPFEINHGFMLVRVSRSGKLTLLNFWHEAE